MDTWLTFVNDFLTADPLRMVVLGSFIGAVLSVQVTWFFSWWYYRRTAEGMRDAALEMKREAQHLRDYLREMVLHEGKGRKII
jgi:hypothetical protein